MSNKVGQKDEMPAQEQVIESLREIVENLLEKDVHPKDITYSMIYVVAEFGFQYEKSHRDVLTGILDSLIAASEEIAEIQSKEENAIDDSVNICVLKTLH